MLCGVGLMRQLGWNGLANCGGWDGSRCGDLVLWFGCGVELVWVTSDRVTVVCLGCDVGRFCLTQDEASSTNQAKEAC